MAGIDNKMAGIATYLPHFFYTAESVPTDDFLWYTDDDDDNFKSFIYIDKDPPPCLIDQLPATKLSLHRRSQINTINSYIQKYVAKHSHLQTHNAAK